MRDRIYCFAGRTRARQQYMAILWAMSPPPYIWQYIFSLPYPARAIYGNIWPYYGSIVRLYESIRILHVYDLHTVSFLCLI